MIRGGNGFLDPIRIGSNGSRRKKMALFSKNTREGYTQAAPGIRMKTLVFGEKTLLAEFQMAQGSRATVGMFLRASSMARKSSPIPSRLKYSRHSGRIICPRRVLRTRRSPTGNAQIEG
jgi:hypothetical protein